MEMTATAKMIVESIRTRKAIAAKKKLMEQMKLNNEGRIVRIRENGKEEID
jgi:hypothetical protein